MDSPTSTTFKFPCESEPLWSRRGLLYPREIAHATPPMWNRPSNNTPIFVDSAPSASPMWDRESPRCPIFIESTPGSPEIWARPGDRSPVCPCCLPGDFQPPPPIPEDRPVTRARPNTARPNTSAGPGLRQKTSMLGLRMKKSFQSLRRKANEDV